MIVALFHGGKLPTIAKVLMAAEAWGCPPWEIAGGDEAAWFWRWEHFTALRLKKHNG